MSRTELRTSLTVPSHRVSPQRGEEHVVYLIPTHIVSQENTPDVNASQFLDESEHLPETESVTHSPITLVKPLLVFHHTDTHS